LTLRETDVCEAALVEILGRRLKMLISREFLFGLSAYVRQAELSLHRTPNNNLEALITYYAENRIPLPHEVLQQLDRHLPGGDLAVKGPLRAAVGLLTGRLSMVSTSRLLALRQELDEYGHLLRHEYSASEADRGRLRLRLTELDLYLCRRFGTWRGRRAVDKVDHLNSAPFLPHRPLRDIAAERWPLIS
jgi:hypothetical protein